MSDAIERKAVARAKARQSELKKELEEIEVFLRIYDKFTQEEDGDFVDETLDPNVGLPQRDFVNLARKILFSSRRPLTSRQILTAFKENRIPVGGADEMRNLTTKLWRARSEISRLPNGTYWPADIPIPEAG